MRTELQEMGQEGRSSRLDGWETNPDKLLFPYYPNKGEESPLFAHIIAMSYIKDGCMIPELVVETALFSAKRGRRELARGLDRWNRIGFLEFDRMKTENLRIPADAISYTFGKFDKKDWGKRTKLMLDALKIEASAFSSFSVN